ALVQFGEELQAFFAFLGRVSAGCGETSGIDALDKSGNLVPVVGKAAPLAQGSTPIVIAWDYNALSWGEGLKGNPPF
ncbi:hypothetical protein ACC754_44900, partial [Rhizobium johnstonii]